MGVGGGALHPWILKFSATKGYFLSFEREKLNFSTFGPPLEKFWKNSLMPPLEKSFRRPWVGHNQVLNISASFKEMNKLLFFVTVP